MTKPAVMFSATALNGMMGTTIEQHVYSSVAQWQSIRLLTKTRSKHHIKPTN
jgi:hypothetical protein